MLSSSSTRPSKKVQKRIDALLDSSQASSGQTSILKQGHVDQSSRAMRFLQVFPSARSMNSRLHQAGLSWSAAQFIAYSAAGAGLGLVLGLLLPVPLFVVAIIPLLTALIPSMVINRKRKKRMKLFDNQLPEALDLISRSLQTGLAFLAALTMVSDEFSAPLGEEFRLLNDEITYGASLNDAFANLVDRTPSEDLRYFVIAMLVQRETGGNLAELTGNISTLIRDRLGLRGKIATLTAEGRASALILTLMPFILAGILSLVNWDYISALWLDPTGRKISGTLLTMVVIGNVVMRKMIQIKF